MLGRFLECFRNKALLQGSILPLSGVTIVVDGYEVGHLYRKFLA